jgi:hypothetical protein
MMTAKNLSLRKMSVTNDDDVVSVGGDGTYSLWGLKRDKREEAEALAPLSAEERMRHVSRWLAFGYALDQRAKAVQDADYLGRETDRMIEGVRTFLEQEVRLRFDPSNENSLTRPIVDHVADSKRALAEAHEHLAELVRVNFDANDARSAVAKIGTLLKGMEAQLDSRFDPKRKDSVLGQFDEKTDLLLKRLAAPDGPFQSIAAELHAMRIEFARIQAAHEGKSGVIERTPIKGGVFEDELEAKLTALARAHGDIVERTSTKAGPGGSKRGDFVVTLAGKVGTIVVEAKGGAITSLPKLVDYLETAKAARSADLAIAVVRDANDMPLQARPFQFYEEGIVVSANNFEFAFKIARWVVALQNRNVPEEVDAAAVQEAVADVLAAVKRLRPARQQLVVIEKAADALRGHLQDMESDIIDAVKGLEESLGDAA